MKMKVAKCKICGKQIESGKYCAMCEMKSKIIFGVPFENIFEKKGNK